MCTLRLWMLQKHSIESIISGYILIKAGLPRHFIDLLIRWYSMLRACARWNNVQSDPFEIKSGGEAGEFNFLYLI